MDCVTMLTQSVVFYLVNYVKLKSKVLARNIPNVLPGLICGCRK
jgi:hypothetical protein